MELLTIAKDVRQESVIEKSRFICTLTRVEREEAAAVFIRELKKQYWDATHNCTAYIIGEGQEWQKSSDDGEPSGTAGVPMLEVLRKRGLHNVLAVVTRYFGGVKLGAGGLARAYGKSVSEAVLLAGLVKKQLMAECVFRATTAEAGKILNILYQQELFAVQKVEYENEAVISLSLRQEDRMAAELLLSELLSKKVLLEVAGKSYLEIPLPFQ